MSVGILQAPQPHILATFSPQVQLNERAQRTFSIHNNGKFSFTFSWELSGPTARVQLLSLSPQTGSVQAEGKVDTQLVFHPRKMCSLKDVELTLQVRQLCVIGELCLSYMPAWQQEPRVGDELQL